MRVLHADFGREMRGGQWQALYLMRGLRERGHDCVVKARAIPDEFPARIEGKFDIVHTHDAKAHAWAAVRGMKPLVVSRRVAFPVKTGLLSRWKYARGHFIAISNFVKGRLLAAGVDESRITVIPDGVPPLRRAPRTDRVVVFDKRIAGATFDPQELPGAGVFVYLSDEEGLGSAVLLAMSAGVPVVASRIGGLPEAVEAGVTGLLVENNPAQIDEAVRTALASHSMAEAALVRYRALFTVERMVERTEALYRRLAV